MASFSILDKFPRICSLKVLLALHLNLEHTFEHIRWSGSPCSTVWLLSFKHHQFWGAVNEDSVVWRAAGPTMQPHAAVLTDAHEAQQALACLDPAYDPMCVQKQQQY